MSYGYLDGAGAAVVCPSISFPSAELRKITGIQHYEERMLFMLLTLRDPGARVIYLTSLPVDSAVVDYYLGFVPAATSARRNLHLLSLDDPEPRALSAKLLERPDVLARLRSIVDRHHAGYIVPFNVTSCEARLADALGLPLYGPRPELAALGSKSGARRLARRAGVDVVDGAEDLWSLEEVERAIDALRARRPAVGAVVIKLNDGFSGQGNAIVEASDLRSPLVRSTAVFCAGAESWDSFGTKIAAGGAVVEEVLRQPGTMSPSVQLEVRPRGAIAVVSTHDQILGGPDDQVYLGCRFPARRDYRGLIQERALRIASALASEGVIGFFGVDFLVTPTDRGPRVYLSEINLRMGGTTHPFAMAQLATGGRYDVSTGELVVRGRAKHYVATDNLTSNAYVGLTPRAAIEAVAGAGASFRSAAATGAILHLLGALPRYGKMGVTCIGGSSAEADEIYARVVGAIDAAVVA